MWHIAQTLSWLCCLLSGPATAPVPKPVAALRLYSSAFEVKQGSPLETVIEITNTGDDVLKVEDIVGMERIVPVPKGVHRAESKHQRDVPLDDGVLRLRFLCEVPDNSPLKMLGSSIRGHQKHVYSVPPGESQLIPVTVPPIAFEPGICALT